MHLRSGPVGSERDERGHRDDEPEQTLGEVPEGLDSDLYPKHLDDLRRDPAFRDSVLSFRDEAGARREVALDDVTDVEHPSEGNPRAKIWLRNGVIVVASGAVIAGAIAALRYRRRRRESSG